MILSTRQSETIRKINLRMRVDNLPAIRLYEKFGFVQEGRLTRELDLHEEANNTMLYLKQCIVIR